jgi:tetratricopeptide (TPR) repeat protein
MVTELTVRLSTDPFNPEYNFDLAKEYERLGQTASAVSFYLRAAEYGVESSPLIVYTSLLKMAKCFDDQNDRVHTVTNCLLQAIAYLPNRPEAYFALSQFHERLGQWQECYTWAEVGLARDLISSPLPAQVGYIAPYCLQFEKAVSAWWIGRKDESFKIFKELSELAYMLDEYKVAVKNNLNRISLATV